MSDEPHWTEPGAHPVAEGIHRIPLPLPMDGLRAVNVYAVETEEGLTLIDGGWAVDGARDLLGQSLASIGHKVADITRFLVTHVHRDHYTQAVAVRREVGSHVSLGIGERATLELVRDWGSHPDPTVARLVRAGATDAARSWASLGDGLERSDVSLWELPDAWLAGDHVLPTITPSIGFESAFAPLPLGDFLASLAKVRAMPDLRLLPAHGPVTASVHARVDELVAHHEERLRLSLESVEAGRQTAYDVAADLPWTRHGQRLAELYVFNTALASLETMAHLDLLAAQGRVARSETDGVLVYGPSRTR